MLKDMYEKQEFLNVYSQMKDMYKREAFVNVFSQITLLLHIFDLEDKYLV